MTKKLSTLRTDAENINQHSERGRYMTEQSVRKFGARLAGVVDKHGVIIDGNERSEVYADVGLEDVVIIDADPTKPVFLRYGDLDLADPTNPARELQVALHRSAVESFAEDADALAAHLANGLDLSDWYMPDELDALIADIAPIDVAGIDDSTGDETGKDAENKYQRIYSRWDVPDALWPSDNDFGIPLLDINMQALSIDQPCATWGVIERTARMNGTWLFYTEDYRYEAIWTDPSGVVNTGCVNAAEPNFSCYSNMPPAVAMWQIYRKRWIARWWQSMGVRVIVDLNVAPVHYASNRMGIPAGWRTFATRGHSNRLDECHAEYQQACEIAGDGVTPLFVVYGGGQAVKSECKVNGWLWIPEAQDRRKGRKVSNG